MVDKIDDQHNFKQNMDAFQNAGYLSERQRGHLDAVLNAGHAAIHRGWEPTLLDITEGIIEVAYLHDKAADTLDREVPPKPPSPRKSK